MGTHGLSQLTWYDVMYLPYPYPAIPLVLEHLAASIWSCMVPFSGRGFITCAHQATHVTFRARYVQSDRGPLRLAKQKEKLQYVDLPLRRQADFSSFTYKLLPTAIDDKSILSKQGR